MAEVAKPAVIAPIKPGTSTSFGPIRQVDAGLLNVGYAEAGPAGGPAAILLHGWPYDIYSLPMSRRRWRPRATGSSSRSFAATGPLAFFRTAHSVTASNRSWRWMSSR